MTNKEKLIKLMKEYGVSKAIYSPYTDLNADRPHGDLVFCGDMNIEFIGKVYLLYTKDGWVDEDQNFALFMQPEHTDIFKRFSEFCTEVLYADL